MLFIKKVILLIAVLSFLTSLQAQNNWTVSVIDSFQTTRVGQGIWGLNSVVHENTIHLTYFYHNQNSETFLFYSMKNGNSFTIDTVATISGFNSYAVSTAMQFHPDGSKWIYAGYYSAPNRITGVYKQSNLGWDYTYIDEPGDIKTVRAIQNNTEMGFAYVGMGIHNQLQSIKYANWNNDQWEITTITERYDTYKTTPSIIESGGKIFLVFGEGRHPDSLITRVYVKENQAWQISFTDLMEIPYAGGSIGGLHTVIGISNPGNPYIMHTLSNEVHPRFYKMNSGVWGQVTINYPASSTLINGPRGSNILFDSENTMFIISQHSGFGSIISWIKENGDAGYTDIPYKYIVGLGDFAILNNEIYVYYYDGYPDYPYNRPVTFKEAKINISTLLTDVDESNIQLPQEFILHQNYPNPFNPTTTIKFSIPVAVDADFANTSTKLVVYNSLGEKIATLVDEQRSPGIYEVQFNASSLASGVYYYRLTSGQFTKTKKLLLLK